MVLANYKPDDTSGNGFGSFHPSDGQTVLIAAGLLLVITVIAFILSNRAKAESPVKQEVEPGAKA
jgi:hypothetical protein